MLHNLDVAVKKLVCWSERSWRHSLSYTALDEATAVWNQLTWSCKSSRLWEEEVASESGVGTNNCLPLCWGDISDVWTFKHCFCYSSVCKHRYVCKTKTKNMQIFRFSQLLWYNCSSKHAFEVTKSTWLRLWFKTIISNDKLFRRWVSMSNAQAFVSVVFVSSGWKWKYELQVLLYSAGQ